MTCVVGLIQKNRVYLGGDSAAVQGWTRRESRISKVFRRGPFLIGYTTSFRMGQLLEHHLEVPKQHAEQDDMAFMVTHFIESVRGLLKEKAFTKIEGNTEKGGQFLVGYHGRLYSIESDFQVGVMADGFDAIGSGCEYALGVMKALERMQPTRRIQRALAVAAHFNMGVCGPFVIKSIR